MVAAAYALFNHRFRATGQNSVLFQVEFHPGRVEEWRHTRRSDLSVAPRFMGRSHLAALSILIAHSIYSTPCNRFRLPLLVYPLAQVLQITGRFYQTPLPPIIARGITKQPGPFAPWELPQFIATPNPSATLSPSFPFPVEAGYRSDLLPRFLSGTRRASPVARHALATVLPLPPRRSVLPPRSARDRPCCLRPTLEGSASGVIFFVEATCGFTRVAAR